MGTRKGRERQEEIWYRSEVAEAPGHPFYRKLEAKLKEAGFDRFCEQECKRYYADGVGRPSLVPGVYFRLMLIGFFEGIIMNEALPGGWPIRSACGSFLATESTRTRRIT